MKKLLLPLLVLAITSAACDGSSTLSPGQNQVRVGYSGAVSGSFSSNGSAVTSGFSRNGGVAIRAVQPNGDGTVTVVSIGIPFGLQGGAGTYTFGSCGSTPMCAAANIAVAALPSDTTVGPGYELALGTLQLTSISNNHARGTFSGTAQGVRGAQGDLTVRNGSFDVALDGAP